MLARFILDIVLSAWEDMDWEKESSQHALFLKIDLDKAYGHIDWNFILNMLIYLGFGKRCVSMITTIFSCSSSFVSINNPLSPHIHLHRSIKKRCPLSPYPYILIANVLGYVLEETLQ